MEEVLAKLIETVADILNKPQEELGGDTTFESLNVKSVNLVQIIAVLEDEYDAEIPFMQFRRNKTLAEAATFIAEDCVY